MKATIINTLVSALVSREDGLLDRLLGAPNFAPSEYQFGLDDKADSRLMPGLLRTAYIAVVGATLRENAVEVPLFDDSTEDDVPSCYDPEKDGMERPRIATLAETQYFASAVWRKTQSLAKHEDASWLRGMVTRHIVKDENGNDKVVRSVQSPVKPFEAWLIDEIASTPKEESWGMALLEARQLHAFVPEWNEGVNEADAVFTEWLNAVPWTRDGLEQTRVERAIQRYADKRWDMLIDAVIKADDKAVNKVLDVWSVLVHSPKMAAGIVSIRDNPLYLVHRAELEAEEQQAKLERMAFDLDIAQRKLKIAEMEKKMNAGMEAIQKQIDALNGKKAEEGPKPPSKARSRNRKSAAPSPLIVNTGPRVIGRR